MMYRACNTVQLLSAVQYSTEQCSMLKQLYGNLGAKPRNSQSEFNIVRKPRVHYSTALQTSYYIGRCSALHCTALYCTDLQSTELQGCYYRVHYTAALHCTALYCTALYYNAMQCNAKQYNAMQCNALHCMHATIQQDALPPSELVSEAQPSSVAQRLCFNITEKGQIIVPD